MIPLFMLVNSFFLFGFSTATHTITLGKPLRDNETLVSDRQNFKLQFFSPRNSTYRYVGVMYNNTPVTTVIWVANRDKPLRDANGTLEISGDGCNLVVLDSRKAIVWSTNHSSPHRTRGNRNIAYLLDTGNLVLRDNASGEIVWESFRDASDSFVQKMVITANNPLIAWRDDSDPAPGDYKGAIEPTGIPEVVVWNVNDKYPYWRSGPWDGQTFIGLPEMRSSYQNRFDLFNDHYGSESLTFTYSNTSYLQYYYLTPSGILQMKVWCEGMREWAIVWSSISNECDVYDTCGPYGRCNAKDKPVCSCMRGFRPRNQEEWENGNWSNGCTRKTPLGCGKNDGKADVFFKLSSVKLPFRPESWPANLEADCGKMCLSNCSCMAYAYYAGIGCMVWSGENMFDVQKFNKGGASLYIRVAYSDLDNKKIWKSIVAVIVVVGFISLALCTYFIRKRLVKLRASQQISKRSSSVIGETNTGYSRETLLKYDSHKLKTDELTLFRFEMLSKATGDFDPIHKLGQGGFGPVYKGKLPNGQEIAVKRLSRWSHQGAEEFMNEVEVISKLQHRNLVRLVGCCAEGEEKALVYEYMSNGSLDSYIDDSNKKESLDWRKRVIIIEGICRGLLYLHRDSRLRIIHRDLKAGNILLDEELNAKISDFGMARIFGATEDQANTTRVVGTYGYMAPEYALEGKFSEKSDVYSFGVLLLEIVCGRRNNSVYHNEQGLSLIAYAWKSWNEENFSRLIDPQIYDPMMEMEMMRYSHVGLLCVQERAKDRPNISTILSMISSEIVELAHPTHPPFFANQDSFQTEKTRSECSVNDVTWTNTHGR